VVQSKRTNTHAIELAWSDMTTSEKHKIKVITLGEILVEIMRPTSGQPLDRPGEFRGPFASGAPAIFAVAAARLGLNSAFIGAVGDDAFGRMLRSTLEVEGVDSRGLQIVPDYATGAAFVSYDDTGEREFVFHIRHAAAGQIEVGVIPEQIFEGVRWLHISGSTLALNENSRTACRRALELTRAAGGKISLDPNLRSELMPLEDFREILSPFLADADLLLPTAGEAQAITGKVDENKAAQMLAQKPDAITVLKRGPAGCSICQHSDYFEVPGFAVTEIDPTGAGDCFSAAFIAGLEAGWSLEQIGRFSNAAGALAITKLGPMEGAPFYSQVENLYD
jgi:sugar/nucleoside kinase (ribokinase family)